jgi:prepilin-type N-terminal cleavage/methylation domain-containing protein
MIRARTASRSGFTLIELLVVIAILGVLMSLTTAAVFKVIETMDRTRIISEVSQLSSACESFRLKYGRYPPSFIKLSETGNYPNATNPGADGGLDNYSVQYLQALFPGIDLTIGHDWNGNGRVDKPNANPLVSGDLVLQGDECLVYFLGGIPQIDPATGAVAMTGFCTDATRPTLPTPGKNRNGPFYEFKANRVRIGVPGRGNVMAVYLDHYGAPYAYFLARHGNQNNYRCVALGPGIKNDCFSLVGDAFVPYCQSKNAAGAITFHRPDKFQIISAGKDRTFGGGGQYDPNAPTILSTAFDRDNLTNFAENTLSTGR